MRLSKAAECDESLINYLVCLLKVYTEEMHIWTTTTTNARVRWTDVRQCTRIRCGVVSDRMVGGGTVRICLHLTLQPCKDLEPYEHLNIYVPIAELRRNSSQ